MKSRLIHLECARCSATHDATRLQNRCGCGGTLTPRYDLSTLALGEVRARPPGPWRYGELLPLESEPVSLGEPQTPLLHAGRLCERFETDIYIKDDSPLPGGTFKGRGASVGLSRAIELGVTSLVMPSAGNAGGAWSLYAARAGIPITVTMAKSAPETNQMEVLVAGGELELVSGTIADAAERAKEIAATTGAFLASTFSEPYRIDGKKSAWLETFDQMGDSGMRLPRTIIFPVGGGVALLAALKAAEEVRALGWAHDEIPRLVGVQAAAVAPIVRAFERGDDEVEPWGEFEPTAAAGLRVPAPTEGALVLEAVRATGGTMVAVPEKDMIDSIRDLASTEGLWACPEGAATLAAAEYLAAKDDLEGPVVLYNTGAGSKYADVLA